MAILRFVTVAGKLLAVMLALLVANPICCCTIGNLMADNLGRQDSPARPSCCAAKKAPGDQKSPDKQDQSPDCPCKKDFPVLAEAKTPVFDALLYTNFVLDPPSLVDIVFVPATTPLVLASSPSPPPPSPSWRLHCRYLL
jgi:hypothetical protein